MGTAGIREHGEPVVIQHAVVHASMVDLKESDRRHEVVSFSDVTGDSLSRRVMYPWGSVQLLPLFDVSTIEHVADFFAEQAVLPEQ